jgi:tetratricopeptide (TPR) repeat protein
MTLVDKSLARQVSGKAVGGGDTANVKVEARFALLEPIREYAMEKLAERGEMEFMQRAHATYYLALAEATMAQWDVLTADLTIKLLDREYNNMRGALQWARDGGHVTVGLQLAGALWRFWRGGGYISEGRVWLEELLALEDDSRDAAAMTVRLRAIHLAAWLASDQHDFTQAEQLFEQSTTLRSALGETAGDANLLLNSALQARAAGQYRRATMLIEEALVQHHALGDRGSASTGGLGLSLYALALVLREQGDFVRSTTVYDECIEFHREIGEREGLAQGWMGLGDIARDQGDVALTRKYNEQSLAIYREFGTQWVNWICAQ